MALVWIANGAVNPAAARPMSTSVGTPISTNAVGTYASGSMVMVGDSVRARGGPGVGLRRRRRGAPGGRECSDMSSIEGTAERPQVALCPVPPTHNALGAIGQPEVGNNSFYEGRTPRQRLPSTRPADLSES